MNSAAQITIVLAGVLVPAVFVLFVIAVTRRGAEFKRLDGLFSTIDRLLKELHKAFAEEKARDTSKH